MRYLGRIINSKEVMLDNTDNKPEILKITSNVETIITKGESSYIGISMVMLDPKCVKINHVNKENRVTADSSKVLLLGYDTGHSIRSMFKTSFPNLFDTDNALNYLFNTIGEDPILSFLALPNIANNDAVIIYDESTECILVIMEDFIKVIDIKTKFIKELSNKKHRPIEVILHANKMNINITTNDIIELINLKQMDSFLTVKQMYLSAISGGNKSIEEISSSFDNMITLIHSKRYITRLDKYFISILLNLEYPGHLTQLFTMQLGFGMTFITEKLFKIKEKSLIVTTTSIKSIPYMINIVLSDIKSLNELMNKVKSEVYDINLLYNIKEICNKEKGIIPYVIYSLFPEEEQKQEIEEIEEESNQENRISTIEEIKEIIIKPEEKCELADEEREDILNTMRNAALPEVTLKPSIDALKTESNFLVSTETSNANMESTENYIVTTVDKKEFLDNIDISKEREKENNLFAEIKEQAKETLTVIREQEEIDKNNKRTHFTTDLKSLICESEQLWITIKGLQEKYDELQRIISSELSKCEKEIKVIANSSYIIAQENNEKTMKRKSSSPYIVEIDIRDYNITPKEIKKEKPIIIETGDIVPLETETPILTRMLKKNIEENGGKPAITLDINLDDYYLSNVETLTKSMLTSNGNMVKFSFKNNIFTVYYDNKIVGSKHFTINQDLYTVLDDIVEENPVPSFTKEEFRNYFNIWTDILTKERGMYASNILTESQIIEMAARIDNSNLRFLEIILILLRWARITLSENPTIYEIFKKTFKIPDMWEENGLIE